MDISKKYYNKNIEDLGTFTSKSEYKEAFNSNDQPAMDIIQYDDIYLKRIVIEIVVYIAFLIIISIRKHCFQT